MDMKVLCECNSFDCDGVITLSLEENMKIHTTPKQLIIVDGCSKGPDPTDTLVEKKDGYSIYKEQECI